jgi:hypothetical protein
VAADDLLEEGQRSAVGLRRGRCRRVRAPQPRLAVREQSALAQDRRGERVAALEQLVERDRLAALDPVGEREVGGGQQPDVVRVLPVDPLEALGDHEPHAGRALGDDAVLARAALAVAPAGDDDLDAGPADRVAVDRPLPARDESGVRPAAERRVEVDHDRQRRDLVGRDLVAQRPGLVARQRAALELRAYGRGIACEAQHARREAQRRHRRVRPARASPSPAPALTAPRVRSSSTAPRT